MDKISRRRLLKLAGAAGLAPVAPAAPAAPGAPGAPDAPDAPDAPVHRTAPDAPGAPGAPGAPVIFQALTAQEADLLDAIVARLIPADENGPGAREANAVRYIDRALAGALASLREAYRVGLAAIDRYARQSRGRVFLELSATDQDSVLIDVETGAATGAHAGFEGGSAQFFNLVRTHTWQGTFGDPYYGGNANFVGWDLLGYPGVRTYVSPDEQRLRVVVKPNRRSAYDDGMFNKATVSAHRTGHRHGD
jgi:gluconate 2-dehydrogenase gamma chain